MVPLGTGKLLVRKLVPTVTLQWCEYRPKPADHEEKSTKYGESMACQFVVTLGTVYLSRLSSDGVA